MQPLTRSSRLFIDTTCDHSTAPAFNWRLALTSFRHRDHRPAAPRAGRPARAPIGCAPATPLSAHWPRHFPRARARYGRQRRILQRTQRERALRHHDHRNRRQRRTTQRPSRHRSILPRHRHQRTAEPRPGRPARSCHGCAPASPVSAQRTDHLTRARARYGRQRRYLNLGKDPLEGSPIPDIFASAAAALKPDPSDGHSLPFPASWLPALLHHSAEPWEAPAVVMAFIFMWRRSNYCRHYSPSAKALVDRLLVKHVSTPPGSIQVHLVKDKNVDAASQHRRSATGSALCPRQLYMTYAATRPSSHPDAPAFQRPNGEALWEGGGGAGGKGE